MKNNIPLWASYGELLKRGRGKAKPPLTQKQLADQIGHDVSIISKFENGAHHPSPLAHSKILEIFKTKLVPSEIVEKLGDIFTIASPADPDTKENPQGHPTIQLIFKILKHDELQTHDLNLFLKDLEFRALSWEEYSKAKKDLSAGDMKSAETRNKNAFHYDAQEGNGFRIQALQVEAALARYRGALNGALDYLDAAAEFITSTTDIGDRLGQIQQDKGDVYRQLGTWSKAKESYEKALTEFTKAGNEDGMADVNRKLAGLMNYQGNPKEAEKYGNKSISIAQKISYTKGEHGGMQQLAWAKRIQGELRTSIDLHNSVILAAIQRRAGPRDMAKNLRYRADAYRMAKMFIDAKKDYEDALAYLDQAFGPEMLMEEKLIRGMIYHGLGSINLEMQNYGEATRFLTESLYIHFQADSKLRQGLDLNQLGRVDTELSNYGRAESNLKKALKYFQPNGSAANPYFEAEASKNLAELYFQTNDLSKSALYANSVIEISKFNLYANQQAGAHLILARIMFEKKPVEIDKGIRQCHDGLKLSMDFYPSLLQETLDQILTLVRRLRRKIHIEAASTLCGQILFSWKEEFEPLINQESKMLLTNWFTEINSLAETLHLVKSYTKE